MAESATRTEAQTLGANRSMPLAFTPHALQVSAADATATPTPRVITIRPTSTPSSLPTATAPPNRAALPTATAPVISIETPGPSGVTPTPTATAVPSTPPTPTPTPLPTATPAPTATPVPTATPSL